MKKKDVFHLEITQRQQQQQQSPQTSIQSYPLSDSSAKHLISPKSLSAPLKISPFSGITQREISPHCADSIFPRKTHLSTNNDVKFQIPLFSLTKRFSDNISVVSSPSLSFRNQTSSMFHPSNSCKIYSPEKHQQQQQQQQQQFDASQRPLNGVMKRLIFPPSSKNEKGLFSLHSDISANKTYSIRFSEAMTANKVKKKIIASILQQQDKGSVFETTTTGSSSLASISPRRYQQQTLQNSLGSTFYGEICNNLRKTATNSVHESGQDQQAKWRKTGLQSLHRNTADNEKSNIFSHLLAQQKFKSKGEGGDRQGVAKLSQAYQLVNVNHVLDENDQKIKQSQFNIERITTQTMNNASGMSPNPEEKVQVNQKMHQEVVDSRNGQQKTDANRDSILNISTRNTNSAWISSVNTSSRKRNTTNNNNENSNAVRASNKTSSSVKDSKSTSLYFSAAGAKKTQNVIQQTTFIDSVEEAFAKEFKWVECAHKEEAHTAANDSSNVIANQKTNSSDSQQTAGSSNHKSAARILGYNSHNKGNRQESEEGEKLNRSKESIGKDAVTHQTNQGSEVNEEAGTATVAVVGAQEILHLDNSDIDAAVVSSSIMTAPVLSESNIEGAAYSNLSMQRTFWYEEPAVFDLMISVFTTKEQFLQKLNKKVNNIFSQYLLSQQQEQQGSLRTLNSPRLTKKIIFTVESLDVLQIIKENNNNSLFELLKTYLRSGLLQTAQGMSQDISFSPRLTGYTTFNSQVKLRSPRVQNASIKCNIIVLAKPRRNFKDAVYSTPQKATKQQAMYAHQLGIIN